MVFIAPSSVRVRAGRGWRLGRAREAGTEGQYGVDHRGREGADRVGDGVLQQEDTARHAINNGERGVAVCVTGEH